MCQLAILRSVATHRPSSLLVVNPSLHGGLEAAVCGVHSYVQVDLASRGSVSL